MNNNIIIALGDVFTPVNGKQAYINGWQNSPKSLEFCQGEIANGRATGYGLVTGNGIVAIDFDGDTSLKIAEVIGSWLLSAKEKTLAWSSGKDGYYQVVYRIPEAHLELWEKETHKQITEYGNAKTKKPVKNTEGKIIEKGHQLEIRYKGSQSVLPPSIHPDTKKPYQWLNETEIATLTEYQSQCLLNAINYKPNEKNGYQDLTKEELERMVLEALKFIPSDNYDVWLDVGMSLKNTGFDCTLWDKWSSSSSKYKSGECEKKWESFNKSGKTLGTLFYLAQRSGFNQKQWMGENLKHIKKYLEKSYSSSPDTAPENNIGLLLNQLIIKLANPSIKKDERIAEVTAFAGSYGLSPQTILKAIDSKIEQNFKEEGRELVTTELDNILVKSQEKLDLPYLVGSYLGICINDLAEKIPTAPEAMLCCLLPMVASLIGTKAKIIVKASSNYVVPFILRTAIIGDSGQKKSPTLDTAISSLTKLHLAKGREYKKAYQDWEANKGTEKTKPPIRKRYIVKDTTFDGLVRIHEENPTGLLNVVDELAGYFKRMNKFARNGNGDDLQRDLELYNGKSYEKTRADDDYDIYLEKTAISATGTIQWHTLENLGIDDDDDGSGSLARWLFCAIDLPLGYFRKDDVESDYFTITDILVENLINGKITSDFVLSEDAITTFAEWQNALIKAQQQVATHRIAIKYPKIEGEAIRIAGILHCIDCVLNGDGIITNVISDDVMHRAITLANWFLGQYHYVFTRCDKSDHSTGKLTKLLQIITRKGECTANQAYLSNKSAFKSAQEVADLMVELVEMGKVTQITTNKGIKVKIS
jgi:hypothetical protein